MTWNEYTGAGLTDGIWWDHGAGFFKDGGSGVDQPARRKCRHVRPRQRPAVGRSARAFAVPERCLGDCFPPQDIVVLVSEDNVKYFYAADMPRSEAVFTKTSRFNDAADSAAAAMSNYFKVVYDAKGLNTHGRYVKFVLFRIRPTMSACGSKQIEIFRGSDSFRATPLSGVEIVGTGPQLSSAIRWQRRLRLDSSLLAARAASVGLDLSGGLKEHRQTGGRSFTDHYRELAHLKTYFPLDPINPGGEHDSLGKIQHDLLRLNAAILRKKGYAGTGRLAKPTAVGIRWTPTPIPAAAKPSAGIDLSMMNGERRAAAVNLTNAADSEATVSVSIDGFAAATRNPRWINVFVVRGTDTQQNVLQSDLLEPLAAGPKRLRRARSRGHDPAALAEVLPVVARRRERRATGTLHISSGGVSHDVPVRLAISRHPFPAKLTLSFGDPWIGVAGVMLFGNTVGSITPANVKAVNALLKDYHVNISGETLNT